MEHFTEATNFYSILFVELKKLGVKVPKTKKLKSSIPRQENCVPEPNNKIFGVSLAKQEWSCGSDGPLPKFLASATAYLLKNSKVVGLFRLAGSIARQRNLRMKLENGEIVDGSEPSDVASLLKQWLRELPEPLIPRCMHDLFIRCHHLEDKENRLAALLLACLLLPPENLYALKHLLCFLQKFAADSYQNKMGLQNLALVMAPNIFVERPGPIDKSCSFSKNLVHKQASVIELLIENCEKVGEILPPVAVHSSTQDASDFDTSSDIIDIETFTSSRKRRNGPVSDLFSGIRKFVGQNAVLPKIQEKSTQLVPRKEISLDGENLPDASKKETRETFRSNARTCDVRKRSFGLLRRKETKRVINCFETNSRTKTSLVLNCQQNRDTGAVSTENEKMGSKLSSKSEETNSQLESQLKSDNINASESDYYARLISKEMCKLSIQTSSPPNHFPNLQRCTSLQWFPSKCTSDPVERKPIKIPKVPNVPIRKGSLIRGKPNTIKSGLPCQHLKEQNYFRSSANKSTVDLTNEKENSLLDLNKPCQMNTSEDFKRKREKFSGVNEPCQMNTNEDFKRKREKYSSTQNIESTKFPTNISVWQSNVNQTPAILSFGSAAEKVIQKMNPVESSTITEKPTKKPNLQPHTEKVGNNFNSMIPRLRKSLEIPQRKSFMEQKENCDRKSPKPRISDSAVCFRSKIPVKLKKNISTPSLDLSVKDRSFKTPNSTHSPGSTSLAGEFNFSTMPEINSCNKRESIAMILKNNSGRVKQTVNMYNTFGTPTSRDGFPSSKRRLSYSSRRRLSSAQKDAKGLSIRENYTSNEEKAHSKSRLKYQRLPPQKRSLADLKTPSPNIPQALKEVTNVHFRSDGVQKISNTRVQDASKMRKVVSDNNWDMNRKPRNLKSNSFTGCKPHKIPKVISRSASSPGCPKPDIRLFKLVPTPSHSFQSVTEEIINQQSSYSSKFLSPF